MGETNLLPALAALSSAATWALGSHLFRRALARETSSDVRLPTAAGANLFKNALAFALFAAVFLFEGGSLPPSDRWWALFASGAFGFAIGDTLYFAALPRCGVQVAAMVGLVNVPVAVALGWILHGEQLAPWALLGAAILVAGVALVLTEAPRAGGGTALRPASDARTRRIGIAFALAAALSQAVGVVIGSHSMHGGEVLPGMLVRMSGGIAGAFVIATLLGIVLPRARVASELADLARPWRNRSTRRGLALAALFGSVLGLPLHHFALRGLESGVAAVLITTTPLFTLPLGLALGERHGTRAALGAVVGLAGVAVVVWATA